MGLFGAWQIEALGPMIDLSDVSSNKFDPLKDLSTYLSSDSLSVLLYVVLRTDSAKKPRARDSSLSPTLHDFHQKFGIRNDSKSQISLELRKSVSSKFNEEDSGTSKSKMNQAL